jgi:hypothetical protein
MMLRMTNVSMRVVAVAMILAALGACNRVSQDMAPRVVFDSGCVQKDAVVRVDGIGEIAALQLCALRAGEPEELLAVGARGYARLDPTTLQSRGATSFAAPPSRGHVVVRDIDGDGAAEFVQLGENWIGKTSVFALDGSLRWQDSDEVTKRAPNATAIVDFNGDGRCEFVTAFNVETSLRVVDCDNKPLPEIPCDQQTHTLLAVDVEGDGREELAMLSGRGLRIVDANGKVRGSMRAEDCGFLSDLELVRDPRPGAQGKALLAHGSKGMSMWTLDGERIEAGDAAAMRQRLSNFDGSRVTAKWGATEWDVRAGLVHQQAFPAGFVASRVAVRFFDGKLAYEELLRGGGVDRDTLLAFGLLALPAEAATERPGCVLVGCGADVIRYRAR